MSRIAVVGWTSMLGKAVVSKLLFRNHSVVRIGRNPISDLTLDLATPEFTEPSIGEIDAIIHCAAAFGDNSDYGHLENMRVNVFGSHKVAKLAVASNCRQLVYAGSLSTSLESISGKVGSYASSKRAAEEILEMNQRLRNSGFCSIRLTQLWDVEGECCRHQPWLGRIVAYASRGLNLRLPNSDGPRNFIFVDDAASILVQSAERGLQGIFTATFPTDTWMLDLAREAYRQFDCGGLVEISHEKAPFRKIEFPHESQLFDLVGFSPKECVSSIFGKIMEASTAHRFGPLDVLE